MLWKPDPNDYLRAVCEFVQESRIGILKPREVSDRLLVVDLDECITCAGMSNIAWGNGPADSIDSSISFSV